MSTLTGAGVGVRNPGEDVSLTVRCCLHMHICLPACTSACRCRCLLPLPAPAAASAFACLVPLCPCLCPSLHAGGLAPAFS